MIYEGEIESNSSIKGKVDIGGVARAPSPGSTK